MKVKSFMKQLALAIVLLSGIHVYAQQQPPSAQDRATRELEMMKRNLSLTSDQESKVQAILTSYATQEDSLRKTSQGNREDMRSKRDELMQKKDAELKAVLTDDQYTKLQEKRKERAAGANQGGQHNGNGGRNH